MSEVFVCEKGQLTSVSKHDLRKAGVVVVEVDDPSKCQFVKSGEVMAANDMLWAALDAVSHDDSYGNKAQKALSRNLLQIALGNRSADQQEEK